MLETTIWLCDKTEIGPLGDMNGTLGIGAIASDGRVIIHTILASDPIAVWTRFRDACDEQIKRLTVKAEEKSINGQPSEEDLALADKIIDSGDLGDFSGLAPIPVPERIEQVVKIPAPMDEEGIPF